MTAQDLDLDGVSLCDGDCDDTDPDNFTGNTEVCDGDDNDCSGAADADASWESGPDTSDTDQDNRFRGGVFFIDQTIELSSIELYLDADAGTVLTWQVFEGAAHPGTMTEIASVTTTVDPLDAGSFQLHGSGPLSATLTAGMYYGLGVHWATSTGYTYTGSSLSIPMDTPFGSMVDGANINSIASPVTSGDMTGGYGAFTAQYEINVHWGGEEDYDGDGELICTDCDDADPDNFNGNTEVCDGADNDCDDLLGAEEIDNDSDGQTECDGDCDDTDSGNFAGNTEVCDGFDTDCSGVADAEASWESGPDTSDTNATNRFRGGVFLVDPSLPT